LTLDIRGENISTVKHAKSRSRAERTVAFPIVGIGASAGGLDAFKKFFSAMPADCDVAFVLIQHLDPTRDSLTADLVGMYTRMRVVQAENGMCVEANRVYVIPPNKYLSISKRTLYLSPPSEPRGLRMAVDFFLRSLAADQDERAIGIILSGTGTDGTLGLKEIKAAGGMTMAEDPATAQHDGMPRSAIASGSTDYILPAEQLADALLSYVKQAYLTRAGNAPLPGTPPDPLASVVALLQASTKFDFSGYKTGTLVRRIERRMSLKQIDRIPAYVELLRDDPSELAALRKDLLITVTSFFRDPGAWQILQERVIRPLVAEKGVDAPLRVWVPACATGEEAYSIAMALIEEVQAAGKSCPLHVFASDVDVEALEVARTGVFPHRIAAQVSPERVNRFFTINEHGYRVNKELRDVMVFAPHNVLSDPPFSKLDLISCRNLLIYIEPELQDRITALLHFALLDGGCLFLGSAEGVGAQADLFEAISKKWRIYRRIGPTHHDRVRFPVETLPGSSRVAGRMSNLHAGRLASVAQQRLLERYAPASVLINRACEILYFHGEIDDYLVHPTGVPTRDLLAKARSGLRSKLRAAVQEAIRGEQRVVIGDVQIRRGSASPYVKITVEPVPSTREVEGLWLVSFENQPETPVATPAVIHMSGDSIGSDAAMVQQLEHELKVTKEDLQLNIEDLMATNEELLSVNEELQSSNEELETSKEELMSVNEELQSSNEELETSKEELQSLNEELTTANTDLGSKIMELEATNNDLDNLLTSTNIATLFLDTQLRIRRFTPAATRLFSLIATDIGRSIRDIAWKFVDPALLSNCAAVLHEPITPKTEVQSQDGQWYVRQVLPYRTRDNRTEGVVITFSDVAAEALQKARLYSESIVDTVREPLLVLDGDMRVRSANQSFYSTFKASPEETVGHLLYGLGDREWDIPRLRMLLAEVLPQEHVLNDFEIEHDFKSIGPRIMLLNARAIMRSSGRPDLILLAIEDITERKHAQQALREGEALKQSEEQVRQDEAELAHALRLSTISEMASNLAHELNQPLSSIANGVEACAQYVRSGKVKSSKLLTLLDEASSEVLRAGSIVEHLRSFIQEREPRYGLADLREIARGIPRLLGREMQQERITFQLDSGKRPLPIHADRIQIEQIIVNLMQNAIDAIREASGNDRKIQMQTRAVNGRAELSVCDSGVGLPDEATERLFDPFFTTKPHGLGMGLAISRSIIEAHQGRIWVECPTDGRRGTTLCITLPLSPSVAQKGGST
jgi:two-component system, chemotaxis family, CheB/CheR fusion protein